MYRIFILLFLATPVFAEDPVVLETYNIEVQVNRVSAYMASMDELRMQALKENEITYADVLMAIYKNRDVLAILRAKKEYRAAFPRIVWFCNCAASQKVFPITYRQSVVDGMKRPPVFYLDWRKRALKIPDDTSAEALVNMVGQATASYPSHATWKNLRKDGATEETATIFVKTVYRESLLQDLNRMYFVTTGSVLMTPLDSVRALSMLGVKLDKPTVVAIMARNKITIDEADLDAALSAPEYEFPSGQEKPFRWSRSIVRGDPGLGMAYRMKGLTGSEIALKTGDLSKGLSKMKAKDRDAFLEFVLVEAPGFI